MSVGERIGGEDDGDGSASELVTSVLSCNIPNFTFGSGVYNTWNS